MNDETNAETPGWNAIDAALHSIYGDVEPFHYAPQLHASLGGPDPLDGISVYSNTMQPQHWHYVTYGFSELYAKESDEPAISGFGYELTFRLAKRDEKQPPIWPLSFLQNIARYVFSSGRTFSAGHKMDLNGPIALGENTEICAIVFALDGQLPMIDTPNGKMEFLQVVGLTLDEYELSMEWDVGRLTQFMAEENRLLVTDLYRKSILLDATKVSEVRARAAVEGSSQAVSYAKQTSFQINAKQGVRIILGAACVDQFRRVLRARLRFQREFAAQGPERAIRFIAHDSPGWVIEEGVLAVRLNSILVERISSELKALRGEYTFSELRDFTVEVVPTEIKDGKGKEVIRVVG